MMPSLIPTSSHETSMIEIMRGLHARRSPDDPARQVVKFDDDDVDKYWLCGLSPHAVLKHTKGDLGLWEKITDDGAKEEWVKLPQEKKDEYGYEYELMRYPPTPITKSKMFPTSKQSPVKLISSRHSFTHVRISRGSHTLLRLQVPRAARERLRPVYPPQQGSCCPGQRDQAGHPEQGHCDPGGGPC